ncbi:unnamed protein product [Caenorhabditis auriculariae]|uniref:Fungal lipase-type domain-containing protein n=1 Tax=Caenorhabditis auriculariae TaxID=2777116 RepID=A0A8S1GVM9_9PELO|nr:unnamed protein product [Caenorhabditis auriculariae]
MLREARPSTSLQVFRLLATSFLIFQGVSSYVYYSEVEAQCFLNLAAAAYADAANSTARQSCIDLSYPDNQFRVLMVMSAPCDKHRNQCQAFVAISDTTRTVIVSFRGTNTGGQLLTEFSTGLVDYMTYIEEDGKGNNVSIGHANFYFLRAMDKMWDEMVEPCIQGRANYTFLVTGHSLGGALASLTAFRIAFRGISTEVKVHTFGEPRVGDHSFASYFSMFVPYAFRIIHYTDPVPHLPPLNVANAAGDGLPYHHPREVWYNDVFTSYTLCSPTEGEDWGCSDKERFWQYGHKGTYRHTHYFNHFLSEYGAMGCNSGGSRNILVIFPCLLIVLLLHNKLKL